MKVTIVNVPKRCNHCGRTGRPNRYDLYQNPEKNSGELVCVSCLFAKRAELKAKLNAVLKELPRYDIQNAAYSPGWMEESPDGEWCRYEDVTNLIEKPQPQERKSCATESKKESNCCGECNCSEKNRN